MLGNVDDIDEMRTIGDNLLHEIHSMVPRCGWLVIRRRLTIVRDASRVKQTLTMRYDAR
jgi:hypothetical protein